MPWIMSVYYATSLITALVGVAASLLIFITGETIWFTFFAVMITLAMLFSTAQRMHWIIVVLLLLSAGISLVAGLLSGAVGTVRVDGVDAMIYALPELSGVAQVLLILSVVSFTVSLVSFPSARRAGRNLRAAHVKLSDRIAAMEAELEQLEQDQMERKAGLAKQSDKAS